MARLALPTSDATGDPFYPMVSFVVVAHGSFSGDLFVQVADRNDDLTLSASWDNAHAETLSTSTRQKIFAGSPGYAYRIKAASSGAKVTWDYIYESIVNYNFLS